MTAIRNGAEKVAFARDPGWHSWTFKKKRHHCLPSSRSFSPLADGKMTKFSILFRCRTWSAIIIPAVIGLSKKISPLRNSKKNNCSLLKASSSGNLFACGQKISSAVRGGHLITAGCELAKI
jgi:hypothetical protein